jgi:hypothetical protein
VAGWYAERTSPRRKRCSWCGFCDVQRHPASQFLRSSADHPTSHIAHRGMIRASAIGYEMRMGDDGRMEAR